LGERWAPGALAFEGPAMRGINHAFRKTAIMKNRNSKGSLG